MIDFTAIVKEGDCVLWTQGPAEPLTLTEALVAQRAEIGPFRGFLGSSYAPTFAPEHADFIKFIGIGAVGQTRKLLEAGALEVIPCHLSQLAELMRSGALKIDVVLLQCAENSEGQLSFGSVNSYLSDAIVNARAVIAEINEQAPWTFGTNVIDREALKGCVRTSRPLLDVPARAPTAEDLQIASHVASLVEDGAVLQVGIGSLPDAILSKLTDHRDLALHSGVIGDGVVGLVEAGVITNARKEVDPGVSVTGGLFGTGLLRGWAHDNPDVRVESVSYTHSPRVLASLARFTTINSAIEVDLLGQVNSEVAAGKYVGTIGGGTDFVRGTQLSPGGRSIIALPAVTGRGQSRIVPQLSGVVTAARADTDYVVTEFGVAALKGQTVNERARRLISISHPDHRENLSRAWAQRAQAQV